MILSFRLLDLVPCLKSLKEIPQTINGGAKVKKTSESEFISDKFKATDERDLVEIQENMTRLGMTATSKVDETIAEPTGKEVK
jgi:hypothetical protein